MNDTIDARRGKERSPNFPFIPLDNALQRAQVLYSHERRGSAPVAAVAKHWGYSETSSGFKQTVGALKSYGLLQDEATSSGRMVRLSELAVRILLDIRPESQERMGYLRQAALSPAVASEIFQRWPEGLPSDHTLSHFLMFDRGFQDDTALRVVKILRQNEAFAGISQIAESDFGNDSSSNEDPPLDSTTLDAHIDAGRATVHRTTATRLPPTEAARSEKIIDPNGLDVTISFSGEPTEETYEFLNDYIELRLKQFQRKAARAAHANSLQET